MEPSCFEEHNRSICARPREEWPLNSEGKVEMYTRRLDLEALLEAAE